MTKPSKPLAAEVTDALNQATQAISDTLESVFGYIDLIEDAMIEIHRGAVERHELLTPEHLVQLRPVIIEQLKCRPLVDGFGILTAPDLFVDCIRFADWWRKEAKNVVPVWLNFDATSVDIYDYLEMEWFIRAQRDNARTVFGPYLDYSGADHYVLTLTSPVVDEVFLGVVGADVRMSIFEAEIRPVLDGCSREVVLVNSERRVVAANSLRWTVGSRLKAIPSASTETYRAVVEVGADSGWVLASWP